MKTNFHAWAWACVLSFAALSLIDATSLAQDVSPHYVMAGPYEVIARDGEFRASKGGSERDMWTARQLAICATDAQDEVQREAFAAKSKEIINAYAVTLQRFDGHDAPLCCIQGYWLVSAMMSLRGVATDEETEVWAQLIRRAFLPTIDKFDADSPYANGNWGAIVNRLRMACALFLGDAKLYDAAVDYYLYGNDNGALPHYVAPSGQCQETGRDQGHAQLGLGALADVAEMAWRQGDDLWGAFDNRLMHGFEYTARYNLGYDVPFVTWQDVTGLYCDWTEPGSMGRGRVRDIYRLPYAHYVGRLRLQMPYTSQLLRQQSRAEKRGDITFYLEANEFRLRGVNASPRLHQLITYPAPPGAPLKHDYDVFVKSRGNDQWTRIDTYAAKVNASVGKGRHKLTEISYCMFDFTGDVYVKVVKKHTNADSGKSDKARIRPLYKGVIGDMQNDSTVQFLLFQPENVSVEFAAETLEKTSFGDFDTTNNLLIFTSRPPVSRQQAEEEARRQGRRFVYIPPGYYDKDSLLPVADYHLQDNTTIYLEGGSYFTQTFSIDDVRNVSILGRGIARPQSGFEGAHVYRSQNVLIDGLVCCTCPIGESHNVTLHDVRSISHPGWGDGLNVFGGSSDILFDRVFCRNSDDCTTAYATRKGFSGSTRNVTMRNSTLWPDVAHPIFIGIHGNAQRGDTIEHLRYENIDILGQAEPQVDYQGCLAINCGDNNLVRDVTFDNIRIEQIEQGCILQVKVSYNQKYCTAPGRGVENVYFKNIRYYGQLPNSLAILNGYDNERQVRNITFEGLKINGRLLHEKMEGKPSWYSTADYVPMYIGNHVSNVSFSADSRHTLAAQSLAYCSAKVDSALQHLRPYDFTLAPRSILVGQSGNTVWNLRKVSQKEWCSGFWPGILWMDFGYNKSEAVKKAAEGYTEQMIKVLSEPVFDHDLGFLAICPLIKGYEFSKNDEYRQAALRAADSLSTLFNPIVGTILSWPRHVKDYGGHNTIIDNMMNLELLFWADSISRKRVPERRLYDMAVKHADTTMKNHFHPDGTCYHVAVYDTLSGRFIRGVTHQGFDNNSMWSRGQAWAIYGFTMVYRFTHDVKYLDFAQKVADIYLKRIAESSDDCVPYWDMDAPSRGKGGTACPKDASAACIVASALLELQGYLKGQKANDYRDFAIKTLQQLSTDQYLSGNRNDAFLLHSTGHYPAGSEIDASIVYADYYYMEALTRLWNLR